MIVGDPGEIEKGKEREVPADSGSIGLENYLAVLN